MATDEIVARPFTAFNFKVRLDRPGDPKQVVCEAVFSDCDGLEMNLEPKTIREGGDNGRQIHLAGPVSYGQLTLKRGMTTHFGLWDWFEKVHQDRSLRVSGEVWMLASGPEGGTENRPAERRTDARFKLSGCLPIKVKAPALSAKDGGVAIEEMQIAYETLTRLRPEATGGA